MVQDASYLRLVTRLLQQLRLRSPACGIWEAADLQWWWRRPRATDRHGQLFWLDERDEPVAAVVLTEFQRSVQCDVLVPAEDGELEREVWREALRRVGSLEVAAEFPVRSDDAAGLAVLADAGYELADTPDVLATWLASSRRPPVPVLAPGYRLVSRAQDAGRPHPMAARNGDQVAERLRQCSLYRPELDLAVEAVDGPDLEIAGYGLFWADPVTRVGLVEPMRTHEAHQRRGIASHILAAGLELLAARGCRRLKVGNDLGLYLRAGFEPVRTVTLDTYARPSAGGR